MNIFMKSFDADFEVKAVEDSDGVSHAVFEGYAATFGNYDLVGDRILPGAFKKSVRQRLPLLWQHSFDRPIGRVTKMQEDDRGLFITGRINMGTEKGRDAYALLKGGDLDSMSIGFVIPEGGFKRRRDGGRDISECKVIEVSIVTLPANPKAKVTDVKSGDIDMATAAIALASSTGMSIADAEIMVKSGLKALSGGVHAAQDEGLVVDQFESDLEEIKSTLASIREYL